MENFGNENQLKKLECAKTILLVLYKPAGNNESNLLTRLAAFWFVLATKLYFGHKFVFNLLHCRQGLNGKMGFIGEKDKYITHLYHLVDNERSTEMWTVSTRHLLVISVITPRHSASGLETSLGDRMI